MDDKCGWNETDSCVCVAKGKFATRECYDSGTLYMLDIGTYTSLDKGLYEGDKCKLPKHKNEDEKNKKLMQFLKGVKTRKTAGKFESVRRPDT